MDLSTIEARKQLASKYAAKYAIDPALLCAVVHHESSWNTWASRYEPMFYDKYITPLIDKGEVHTATEANARATSYGLLQIMGQVARERGFAGKFLTELCDPEVCLEYGCRKLKMALDHHPGNVRAALLEWNGGGDQQYPDLVLQFLKTYQMEKTT